MTKKIKTEIALAEVANVVANEAQVNKYITAIDKRLDAQKELNTSDTSKLNKARAIFANTKVFDLLTASNVDETFIYEVSKKNFYCAKSIDLIAMLANAIANNLNKHKEFNDNMRVATQTLINLHNANFTLTKEDVTASLDKSFKVKNDEKQRLILSRQDAYSSAKRQDTMMLNMLRELTIIKHVSKDEYSLNDNAIAQAFVDYMTA